MLDLRSYQDGAVNGVLGRFDAGDQRTLAVMATGTGKTVVAGHVARRRLPAGRVMALCHRDELIRQMADKLGRVTGVMPAIEKADERSMEDDMHGRPPIVVSSIQTQVARYKGGARMDRFDPGEFATLIVDEAHHAPAGTWERCIDYYARNPRCGVLGLTATADRADKEALGQIFQSVAYRYELPDAIDDGYLVRVVQNFAPVEGLDLSRVATTAGDLNAGETEKAILLDKPFLGIVHATIEVACGLPQQSMRPLVDVPPDERTARLSGLIGPNRRRRTLIFTVGVEQAERTADVLNRWLPESADFVAGSKYMTLDRRRRVLRKYRDGGLQFLVNCQVATEGFDDPGVELVAVARPTKSRSLYTQMVGRATRPADAIASALGALADAAARRAAIAASEKPACEVLDFVGNSGRHRLVTTIDLLGCAYDPAARDMAAAMAAAGAVDVAAALELSREELDRKKREAEGRRKREEEESERRRAAAAARRAKVVGTSRYRLEQRDPFDRYAPAVDRDAGLFDPPGIPLGQLNIIRKAKVPEADVARMTPAAAAALSREIVRRWKLGLCSYAQAKVLKRAGYDRAELHDMSFADASAAIAAAKANGWRRPEAAGVPQ